MKYKNISDIESEYADLINKDFGVRLAWAESKAAYESLHNKKTTFLAALMNEIDSRSATEKKIRAEADPTYAEFMEGLAVANKIFLQHQAKKEYLQDKIDFLRTLMANRREEAKRGI